MYGWVILVASGNVTEFGRLFILSTTPTVGS
jgi:hypothetical protein